MSLRAVLEFAEQPAGPRYECDEYVIGERPLHAFVRKRTVR
jgi:hypothetical protein